MILKCPNCGCDNPRQIVKAPSDHVDRRPAAVVWRCLACRTDWTPGQPLEPKQ